jgi:hypothetical protein
MPQPDSSRHRAYPARPGGKPAHRPKQEPEKDGRTPDDRDGNEELEREQREQPPARSDDGDDARASSFEDSEDEDTGQWVATERFALDDELDDTWPHLPWRHTDD